ncbi:MAG: glycosyltransferase family 2 protein [Lachnospiraceae bacterium]|nr:glycosyltransferase family 2 protein [Lachnospiraceae bacterium]
MEHELLIIIPAYNEEKNLPKVLDDMKEMGVFKYADVLVMNDASSDNTNWVAKAYPVNVVTHVFNLGYGLAIQMGYKYAVRRGYSYVIQMDADGQHDVKNIKNIFDELKRKDEDGKTADIVIGSRFVSGATKYKIGLIKKFAINMFSFIIKSVTGVKIMDTTSGLQGLSFKAFLYYSIYTNFDDKYPDANMIMQMLLLGFNIREIPAEMHQRQIGKSMHSGLKPIIYMIRVTMSIFAVLFRYNLLKKDKGILKDGIINKKELEN